MLTIKYSQVVGVKPVSTNIPEKFALFQNYPNPFNPVTTIKFNIGEHRYTVIKVYDILGKEIQTLVDQFLKPGNYEIEWNAVNKTSGIYFYKLITENYSITKKMVLLK